MPIIQTPRGSIDTADIDTDRVIEYSRSRDVIQDDQENPIFPSSPCLVICIRGARITLEDEDAVRVKEELESCGLHVYSH